jgi:alpha-galactosidase
MAHLDPFTLNVLCNSEVIDIDQNASGKQGAIVRKTNDEFVLAKSLENGSIAVGLFNLSGVPRTVSIDWTELGRKTHRERVRDVWRQRNLGSFRNGFASRIPAHGVTLLKLTSD